MKLRQKLALVLASAMIVTAVPVVTFAESTNKLSHPISSVAGTTTTAQDELKLIMDFGSSIEKNKTVFYVDATDFVFSQTEYAKLNLNENAAKTALNNGLTALTGDALNALGIKVDGIAIEKILSVDEIVYDGNTIKAVKAKVQYQAPKETKEVETVAKTKEDVQISAAKIKDLADRKEQVCKDLGVVIDQINEDLGKDFTYFAANGKVVFPEFDQKGNVTNAEEMKPGTEPVFSTEKAIEARATSNYAGTDLALLKTEWLSGKQLRVTVFSPTGAALNASDVKIGLPIMGTVEAGTPKVTVDPLDSYASGGFYYLTRETVEDGNELAVKVNEAAPVTVNGGELAGFTITEKEEDALKTGDRDVTFTLPASSDLVFSKASVQEKYLKFTGKRAFALTNEKTKDQSIEDINKLADKAAAVSVSADGKKLTLTLPNLEAVDTTTGEWVISGLQVQPEDARYEASLGDIMVTIDGEMVKKETVKMGVVTEFDQTLTAKEVVELISGKGSKEVTVTLQENVKESLDDKRWAIFELSEGAYIKVDADDAVEYKTNADKVKYAEALKANSVISTVKVNGTEVTMPEDMLQLIVDADGNVKGFKVDFEYTNTEDKVDLAKGYLNPNKANSIAFTFNVQADSETTGDVTLSATSRAFEVEPVKVATVTAPIEINFEPTTVKVGLEKQALGAITIKETAAGMFTKGEVVIATDEAGLDFVTNAKDLKVTTTGTLKAEVSRVTKDGAIVLNITRQSQEAGEIKIEGIVANIDRTVPEGSVALAVYGDSLRAFDGVWGDSVYNETDGHRPSNGYVYEANSAEEFDAPHRFVKDGYVIVGTKNTEDLPNAAQSKEIILTVNSTSYTVNGEAKTADAAAFIDANNRTMVPVRFVAEEFGKIEFGTLNGVGTVTVFKDGNVLQFQNGSKIMNKNGIAIPMDTATVIKDGRTYVPFKYVAQGLGINYSFDDATKSITFTNQVK